MDVALNDGLDVLQSAARSVGAEVSRPGSTSRSAGHAWGGNSLWHRAAIRSRVDMATVGANWPAPFRVIVRVLCAYSSTVVFAVLMQLARFIMREVTWPSRSYLLAMFAKLALAWLVDPPEHIGHSQPVHACGGWCRSRVARGGAQHHRPARPGDRGARLGLDHVRRPAADAAVGDPSSRCCSRWRCALSNVGQAISPRAGCGAVRDPDAVGTGAAGQGDPAG